MRNGFRWVVPVVIAMSLTGCAWMATLLGDGGSRRGTSSSLVAFLYPDGEIPPPQDAIVPTLPVPLRVGLAFVPSSAGTTVPLSEARLMQLLERVKAAFKDQDFLREFVVVPTAYLAAGRGFDTIDQIARLYQLDAIALVSYDQVAMSSERTASFLYWTIIGAYVIEGTKNDVQTFVDTAIFDIPTRTLLFRAAGSDQMSKDATLVGTDEQVRRTQDDSFTRAMEQMTTNLQQELVVFRERIKSDGTVRLVYRASSGKGGGSGGGGAFSGVELLGLLIVLGLLSGTRQRASSSKHGSTA